jgi:hypothetical protein
MKELIALASATSGCNSCDVIDCAAGGDKGKCVVFNWNAPIPRPPHGGKVTFAREKYIWRMRAHALTSGKKSLKGHKLKDSDAPTSRSRSARSSARPRAASSTCSRATRPTRRLPRATSTSRRTYAEHAFDDSFADGDDFEEEQFMAGAGHTMYVTECPDASRPVTAGRPTCGPRTPAM